MTSSARRALDILKFVNAATEPIGVTAIAERAGIVPGTAFRSLDALERCQFVERYRASTQYQVGPAAKRLKHALYAQFGIRQVCMPYLRRLTFAHGETTSLVVPVGWYAVRIATVGGTRSVRTAIHNGLMGFLDDSFAGRSILASFDKPELARFARDTATLHPDGLYPGLDDELQAIRDRGFAIDTDAGGPRHCAVALPVRLTGRAIACITIDGPVYSLDAGETEEKPDWQATIDEIESHVTHFPPESFNPFAHLDPTKIISAVS